MKRVVVVDELHDADIRPSVLLSEFKDLSIQESQVYFKDPASLVDISCPACDCAEKTPVFTNHGFQYNQCTSCKSLFVSPRPSAQALETFYNESRAGKFRVEHFARQTAESRRSHVMRSRVNWMGQMLDQIGRRDHRSYADMGTLFPILLREVGSAGLFDTCYSVNPPGLLETECSAAGAQVRHDLPNDLEAVTAFEQLDHQFSPSALLQAASDMLAPGGVLFFTTRTISGFDLQMLWDKTPYIFVPEHLNLLSVEGIDILVSRAGFHLLELSTPGLLDVELVLAATQADPTIELPPFVEYFLHQRDSSTHVDFQAFLQQHRLSSHVRVAAQK